MTHFNSRHYLLGNKSKRTRIDASRVAPIDLDLLKHLQRTLHIVPVATTPNRIGTGARWQGQVILFRIILEIFSTVFLKIIKKRRKKGRQPLMLWLDTAELVILLLFPLQGRLIVV